MSSTSSGDVPPRSGEGRSTAAAGGRLGALVARKPVLSKPPLLGLREPVEPVVFAGRSSVAASEALCLALERRGRRDLPGERGGHRQHTSPVIALGLFGLPPCGRLVLGSPLGSASWGIPRGASTFVDLVGAAGPRRPGVPTGTSRKFQETLAGGGCKPSSPLPSSRRTPSRRSVSPISRAPPRPLEASTSKRPQLPCCFSRLLRAAIGGPPAPRRHGGQHARALGPVRSGSQPGHHFQAFHGPGEIHRTLFRRFGQAREEFTTLKG